MDFSKLYPKYDKYYKYLMIITFGFLILSGGILGYSKLTTGEFIGKDISLKGGLLITVETGEQINIKQAESDLTAMLGTQSSIRELKSISSSENIGYIFEHEKTSDTNEVKSAITEVTGLEFVEGRYTIEEMSSSLGDSFFQTTIKAILLAFLFMSIVVFYYFRTIPVSGAIILCAASDLIGTMAIMNLIGMNLSTAGVAAFLMLIGYSVDSDILLSTRVVKRTEGNINDRIFSSIGTGMTMQMTTIVAMVVLWIFSPAETLKQIAGILVIGLCLDTMNTWIQNAGILKWYLESKGAKNG